MYLQAGQISHLNNTATDRATLRHILLKRDVRTLQNSLNTNRNNRSLFTSLPEDANISDRLN